jgi:hypothetical protein
MMKVIPTDVYDKDGNLLRVEFHDLEGKHQLDAEWDSRDEQTSENREKFRKWAYQMAKRLEFQIAP